MPWLATTHDGAAAGAAGVVGKFWWFRPDADTTGLFNEVPLPSDAVAVNAQISWAGYQGVAYGVGGWTDNITFTGDFKLWTQGIDPPTVVPTVAVGAGPGITAGVICYLRYLDINTGERSPLSSASPTISPANQSIDWTSLASATSLNPRVTHIEGWRSVDGSLPRLVWSREVGVTAVNEATAAGNLGEAFTEDYDKFPRCRYNVVWHERQVMAGNDEHPDTIYFSLIGFPERRSSLTLRTKSGHPVIGLVVVRDTLIVTCRAASEVISGFTEDDLQIQIAQPRIGALSHWSVQVIHGLAFIWADLGLYLCDGSSWFYMGEDVQTEFSESYLNNRAAYEKSFATHDPVTNVVQLHAPITNPAGTDTGYVWIADYNVVLPQQGGNYSQPSWSYDAYGGDVGGCAAVLAVPGGHRGDTYFGTKVGAFAAGRIYRYDPATGPHQAADTWDLTHTISIVHGADAYGDQGGDTTHGKRFTEIDVFMTSEQNAWELEVLGGDEWIDEQGDTGDSAAAIQDPQFGATVAKSRAFQDGTAFEKRSVHSFKLPSVTGRRCVVRLTVTLTAGGGHGTDVSGSFEYNGYQIYWVPGPTHRKLLDEEV